MRPRGLQSVIGRFSVGKLPPFDPAQHYVVRRDAITPPISVHATNPPIWVVSRACCACRFVDLTQVPLQKRDGALKLAALGWAPYADAAFHVLMQKRFAVIYAWDRSRIRQSQLEAGVKPELQTTVPESALIGFDVSPAGTNEGARHLINQTLLEGAVSRVYLGTELVAEQWWPSMPADGSPDWSNFIRSVGIAADATPSPLSAPRWLVQPAGHDPLRVQAIIPPRERIALFAVGLIMLIATVWYANAWRLAASAVADAEASLAKTEKELNASLAARNAALTSQTRVDAIARLLDRPYALGILGVTTDLLTQATGNSPLQVEEWDLRGTQLRIVISSTALPPATTLVKAFEKVKTFQDVEATMDGTRLTLTAKVNASQVVAGPPPAAVAAPALRGTTPALQKTGATAP